MKGTSTVKAAVALCLAPSFASAGIVYSDGGYHYLDSNISESVLLQDGSSLRIGTGAVLTGDGSNSSSFWSRSTLGSVPPGSGATGTSIQVTGNAQINQGSEPYSIARLGRGSLSLSDSAVVNGNVYGFSFSDHSALRTNLSGNSLINGNVESDGLISISGNARINGNLFEANGGISLRMDGGSIAGNVRAGSLVDHSAYITGGSIEGGIFGDASTYDFSLRGGTIEGRYGVRSRNQSVEVHGGAISGGMEFAGTFDQYGGHSAVSLFGGSIDVAGGAYLLDFLYGYDPDTYSSSSCGSSSSTFSIWGGQLGHNSAGNGLHLDYCATLDIYGTNLSYAGGMLTGMLADGSLLNLSVTEESRWGGALRLHDVAVPEPGTMGLFATALAALGFMRRRKATAI